MIITPSAAQQELSMDASSLQSPPPPEKRTYESPELKRIGNVREAKAGGPGQPDSGGLTVDFTDFTLE
jgi:hypothetical protein